MFSINVCDYNINYWDNIINQYNINYWDTGSLHLHFVDFPLGLTVS